MPRLPANFHAYPFNGRWAVRKTASSRNVALHDTKEDAWEGARRLAREGGVVAYLHDSTGRITAREDFRNTQGRSGTAREASSTH